MQNSTHNNEEGDERVSQVTVSLSRQTLEEPKEKSAEPKERSTPVEYDRLINKWIRRSLHEVSLKKLNAALLPVVPQLADDIREAHQQGLDYMEAALKTTVSDKVKERELVDKMKTLDKLIHEAKDRDPVEKRLVPSPHQVSRSISCKAKGEQIEFLIKELDRMRNQRIASMENLKKLKAEHARKETNISKDIANFEQAFTIAETISVEELFTIMDECDLMKK